MTADLAALAEDLRATALGYPETVEESPWGDRVVKVRKKVFVFLGTPDPESFGFGLKLPASRDEALRWAGVTPMGYGLGKSGWVSARFRRGEPMPPFELVLDWLDESFRAVAPKTVAKKFPGRPAPKKAERAAIVEGAPTVLLVGDDPLRLERCRAALAERGVVAAVSSLDGALDADEGAATILVDLSRHAERAIALTAELGLARWDARIAVAGVRDADMERRVRAELPKAAFVTREPPGDDGVVALLLQR
jgi:hypothetical protein